MDPADIRKITIAIEIILGLATLGFVLSIFVAGFNRSLGRLLRNMGLARLVRPEYSIWDLVMWSRKNAEAMLQVTKAYDWRVLQWSGLATGILTATLAFVSAVVVEYFKNPATLDKQKLLITLLGIWASLLVYLMAQRRVTLLRKQFLGLYSFLRRLKGR